MNRHSSKPNKLRNVNPIRGRTGNVTIQKWKIYYSKSKSSRLDPTCPYIYQQPRKDVSSNLPAHTLISTNPERRGLKPNCPYTLTDNPGKMRSQTYLPRHLACTFFMPLNSYLKTTSPDTLISLTDKPRKIPLYTGLRHTCPYTLQTNLERCRSTNTGFIPK